MSKNVIILGAISIVIIFFVFRLVSCFRNLEINTTDPQSSSSLAESKSNHFFISEYSSQDIPDSIFKVKAGWLEYVWKHTIIKNKEIKEKMNEVQLVLTPTDFRNPLYREENYLINWQIESELNGVFGMGNGTFILFLKKNELPDSFKISISKIRENRSTQVEYEFTVRRKQKISRSSH